MTEEEAKTKWCPFARGMMMKTNASGNRGFNVEATTEVLLTFCVASACMAWRWSEPPGRKIPISAGGGGVPDAPGEYTLTERYRLASSAEREGRCGLAGAP